MAQLQAGFCCPRCNTRLLPQLGKLGQGVYSGNCTGCGHRIRFRASIETESRDVGVDLDPVGTVTFFVNGIGYQLPDVDPVVTLNDWLKEQPDLKGTKHMCQEGGCGACIVALTRHDPRQEKDITIAINSCLFPLVAADGCSVTTTDGIGSPRSGFHPIQERLADHNGSQCGFCSPGMVMNMYSLLKENSRPTKKEIEDSYDGNICRCTGYRAILDAMKSFAVDENPIDIEDLPLSQCNGDCTTCSHSVICHMAHGNDRPVVVRGTGASSRVMRFKPSSLQDALDLLDKYKQVGVQLVAGDTGKGVFKYEKQATVLVDITGIPSFSDVSSDKKFLTVGSVVTLSGLISELEQHQQSDMPQGSRLSKLAMHLRKIANVAVRNVATWAGNLMLTHNHADFPSDVFTIMQAAGASLNIIDNSATHNVSLPDFLQLDMAGKIITSIVIPFDEPNEHFLTFKIMPRHVNAHAYVNAGFRLVSTSKGSTVVGNKVLIMYGGIGPYTIQAAKTAKYLMGKDLSSQETLNGVMAMLSSEISPDSHLPAASPQYRKSLALSLFYKFYLSVLGSSASSRVLSASSSIVSHRPVSSGIQKYSTDPSKYPLTQPMTKMAAKLQTSGKAEYVNDIPIYPNEARGAFVTSTQANAKLVSMDASTALAMPGVIAFLQAKDIPSGGINNWRVLKYESGSAVPEMLFTDDYIGFAGQSVGLIVADTQAHADMAARAVRVTQSPLSAPILTIQDAITANSLFPDILAPLISGEGDPMDALKASKHVISGEISCGYQYHFHMETQRCLTVPTDSGLDVYSSTQWMDYCQESVAQVLGVKKNSVNVSVKRLGGGFGGKILNSHLIAAATSLAASKLNRPVRVVLDLDTNMQLVGGRPAWLAQYQVGCDDSGKLNCVVITLYMDCGITNDGFLGDQFIDNAYYSPHWKVSLHGCKTHTPTSTACRAPGSAPDVFIMESVMEHVAKSLGKTPEDVRVINLYQKGQVTPYKQPLTYCNISSLWSQLMDSCEFTKRQEQVEAFNKANRWKKRGLSVIPLKFGIGWTGAPFSCVLSVYAGDASVMITTGGIEMGQGLTTKIVQVTAFTLGIDVDLIRTRPSNVLTAPNNSTTGGSIGSELSCAVAVSACKQLLVQMKPARDQLSADATWLQVVTKCFELGIDLQAKAWIDMTSSTVFNYNSYGVTCTEVELDVLTGENQILRTDILYDCGESMNPEIDVGQAEGAFVFGLGFFLTEHFIRDPSSGQLLTKNTWEYKPCTALDIPIDFRVTFLKDAPNPLGILRSKAVGEPPLCMSCSALFAIKHAVENARAEIQQDTFFPRSGPATVDAVQSDCLVNVDQFTV